MSLVRVVLSKKIEISFLRIAYFCENGKFLTKIVKVFKICAFHELLAILPWSTNWYCGFDKYLASRIAYCKFWCTLLRREGKIRDQKNKFGLYQSATCHRVTTFYRIAKSSFMTKIWRVKVRGVLRSPIQSIGGKMTKNGHFRTIFSKVLVS